MPRIRLQYAFEFAADNRRGQDVHVAPEAFGKTWSVGPPRVEILIRIPELHERLAGELTSGYGSVANPDEAPIAHMLRAFEVTAEYDEPQATQQLEASSKLSTSERREVLRQLHEVDQLAREAATRFAAWIKLERPWLGATHVSPRLRATPQVIDVEHRQPVDVGIDEPPSARHVMIMGQAILSEAHIDDIADEVRQGQWPPLDESLLADARDAAHWSTPPDLKTAVLFAAIAIEFRMRDALLTCARPEVAPLVEHLLPNDRPARMRVSHWPTKIAKAVLGRSLADDDPTLYQALTQLIAMRNRLAHRGAAPEDAQEVKALIAAAMKIGDWLDADPGATRQKAERRKP